MDKHIKIKGARTHNLKNIDLNLPKNNLITVVGKVDSDIVPSGTTRDIGTATD